MNEPIISVSGLRGIIGDSLTPLVAARYTAAFAKELKKPGSVLLTRDGRTSGPMLASAIASAIQASGLDVIYADIAATPTTGILVRQHGCVAGIQISASHNPPAYNGIKLFGNDGRVISAGTGQKVLEFYQKNESSFVDVTAVGKWREISDTVSAHLQRVLNTVDRDRIKSKEFKVVLDCNHGAGSILGRILLDELGCKVNILGGQPDGLFAHPPEPTAANLQGVATQAKSLGADVVFCQDPDADRLAIIDEQGNYIGEEYTLALTLENMLSSNNCKARTVVTNCSSSRMSADIATKYGAEFVMSAVGEANVTDKMIASNAIYGGEGNGGPIDPRVGFVRDSFAAMAQVLDLMAKRNLPISRIAAELPRYEICKTTIAIPKNSVPAFLEKLQKEFPQAKSSRMDGLRLDWPNKWLLVRASNTEPIVRAIAEAKTMDEAKTLCDRSASLALDL